MRKPTGWVSLRYDKASFGTSIDLGGGVDGLLYCWLSHCIRYPIARFAMMDALPIISVLTMMENHSKLDVDHSQGPRSLDSFTSNEGK